MCGSIISVTRTGLRGGASHCYANAALAAARTCSSVNGLEISRAILPEVLGAVELAG